LVAKVDLLSSLKIALLTNNSYPMHKSWSLRKCSDEAAVELLKTEINVSELIANLLVQRGIKTFDEAKDFFRPKMEKLHDPFLLKDMDKAVVRLSQALKDKEKVLVYGDYDVDGTTSVALVYSFLGSVGLSCEFYVPDRYKEGYGISYPGVDFAKETGCTLMIALDCGIKAMDQIAYANGLGIDAIICDHHKAGTTIPDAIAVLDPQRNDCSYPFKGLSGCGVGYKMLQAFCVHNDWEQDELFSYLDLVTISIGADIVPVTDENRIMARYGLELITTQPRPGVACLFKHAGFKKSRVTISDVVFILAPRINAAGRIQWAGNAVQILTASSFDEANEFCQIVEKNNKDRRELDHNITIEALELFDTDDWLKSAWTTVVRGENWHKGVIGIVASRLIEKYYRPTIVFTLSKGKLTGSARSIQGIDVHEILEECSEYIEQFGGHAMAAGLTIDPSHFESFKKAFDQQVRKRFPDQRPVRIIEVDAFMDFSQIASGDYKILRQFEPFGPGNMKPIFLTENVVNAKWTRTIGSDNSHLKLHVKQADKNGPEIKGVAFRMADRCADIVKGSSFDLIYTLEENEWQGKVNIEINARDLQFVETPEVVKE
jgi:single-stranded-DNA-specific exonuclease